MNIFGINGGELVVLIVLALLLLGPEKIPQYLRTLRGWIHKIRQLAEGAKEQFQEETGTDFDDVDWKKYDPRQYDPRRVIREALSEPIDDLETTLRDAKDTVHDAADTVVEKPPERPALTQEQIIAAAVPIDQLDQQPQLPDPGQPQASVDAAAAMPEETQQPLPENPSDVASRTEHDAQPAAEEHTEPEVRATPYDAEAT